MRETKSASATVMIGQICLNTRKRKLLAVLVATAAVSAAGLGVWAAEPHSGRTTTGVIDDGLTLYEAIAGANRSVTATPGGPWTLSQVYGIASPVPVDPSSWGYDSYDAVLTACQAAFNGLTLWNGTIPLFNGTYNSGTAPFWQFVFFSNASQQLLVVTNVLGITQVFPPISMTSQCAVSTGLSNIPWGLGHLYNFSEGGFVPNSPGMVNGAAGRAIQNWTKWVAKEPAEMFIMGGAQFGSGQPPDTMTNFFFCGTLGGVGLTHGLDVMVGDPDTQNVGLNNYTLGCTPDSDNLSAIPVQMNFSEPATLSGAGSIVVSSEFQFWNPQYSAAAINFRGITSWMVTLSLTGADRTPLAVAGSDCATWVPTLRDCPANASGWYAVLLGPNGEWDGSFGAHNAAQGWSYPVLPIASNETLAVVVPSNWNVTGDSLEVTSTTGKLPLTGSVVLD